MSRLKRKIVQYLIDWKNDKDKMPLIVKGELGSLDDEAQEDLRLNKNFNTYKGAIYENIVGKMLVKQVYKLYFYNDYDEH